MADMRRIDVGFQGGQVLAVRTSVEDYEGLVAAFENDGARWHTLEADGSSVLIDLANVVYVQRESGDQKVGF